MQNEGGKHVLHQSKKVARQVSDEFSYPLQHRLQKDTQQGKTNDPAFMDAISKEVRVFMKLILPAIGGYAISGWRSFTTKKYRYATFCNGYVKNKLPTGRLVVQDIC